tara:strand:+ start:3961 stop:10146 length:6186 start_codon:yes stop_codon:yes gene_type:complete
MALYKFNFGADTDTTLFHNSDASGRDFNMYSTCHSAGEAVFGNIRVSGTSQFGIICADSCIHLIKSSGNAIIKSESGNNAGDLYLIGNRTSNNDTSNLTFYNSSEPIARIRAYRHGANDAGKLTFATQATGGNPVEHMTICPDGKVCATSAFYGHLYGVDLKITGTSCFQQNICLQGGNRAVVVPSGYGALQAGSCENIRFCTNGIVYVNSTLCTGNKWKVTEDGVTSWGDSQAQGTLTWDTGKAVVGGLSGNALSLIAGGSSKLFICTGGNVGIGTASPAKILEISCADQQVEPRITSTHASGYPSLNFYVDTTTHTGRIQGGLNDAYNAHGSNLFIHSPESGSKVVIRAYQCNAVYIVNDGNVGIGTATPCTSLTVATPSTFTDHECIKHKICCSGIHILGGTYASGNAYGGLVWSDSDQPTKPKAGIWSKVSSSGSCIIMGTSNSYVTGITNNAFVMDQAGNFYFYGNAYVVGTGARTCINDGTNVVQMGLWDGATNRIESFGGRPLFITSYSGGIRWGLSGSVHMCMDTSGNLGIGSSFDPTAKLMVSAGGTKAKTGSVFHAIAGNSYSDTLSGGANFVFENPSTSQNAGDGVVLIKTATTTGTAFAVCNNTANIFNICNSGNVGIGTDTPAVPLHVSGVTCSSWFCADTGVCFKSSSACISLNQHYFDTRGASGAWCGFSAIFRTAAGNDPNNKWVGIGATNDHGWLSFASGADKHLVLCSDGKVGIGTTAPDTKLEVKTSVSGASARCTPHSSFILYPHHSGDIPYGHITGGNFGTGIEWKSRTYNNSTVKVRGYIRYGLWDNSSCTGAGYGPGLAFGLSDCGNDACDPTTLMTLRSSGNVGIGTTSPAQKLHVCGTGQTQVLIQSNGSSRAQLKIYTQHNEPNDIIFGSNGDEDRFSLSGRGSSQSHQLIMYSNNAGWQELQKWHFDCDVVSFPSGCVGIGTDTPSEKLTVRCSQGSSASVQTLLHLGLNDGTAVGTGSALFLKTSNNQTSNRYGARIWAQRSSADNGEADFGIDLECSNAGQVNRFFIDGGTGNVGIGCADPTEKLHVNGSILVDGFNNAGHGIFFRPTYSTSGSNSACNGGVFTGDFNGSGHYDGLKIAGWDGLGFYTNNEERIRICNNGNVGIGQDNPTAKFHLSANQTGYTGVFYNSNAASEGVTIRAGNTSSQNSLSVQNYDGNTAILTARSDGNVGIGDANPDHLLSLQKTDGAAIIAIDAKTGTNTSGIILRNEEADKWIIKNDGGADQFAIYNYAVSNTAFYIDPNVCAIGLGRAHTVTAGSRSTAIGFEAKATGAASVHVTGDGGCAVGDVSSAFGKASKAIGACSTAIGACNVAEAAGSTAIGFNASTNQACALILGGCTVGIGTSSPASKLVVAGCLTPSQPAANGTVSGAAADFDGGDIYTGRAFFQGYKKQNAGDLIGINRESNNLIFYNYTDGCPLLRLYENGCVVGCHFVTNCQLWSSSDMAVGNFLIGGANGASDSFKMDQGTSVFDMWVKDSSITCPRNIFRAYNNGSCIVIGQGCNADDTASIPVYFCGGVGGRLGLNCGLCHAWKGIDLTAGSYNKFYPVGVNVGCGDYWSDDEVEIVQYNVHSPSSGCGAMYLKFRANITGWGHINPGVIVEKYNSGGANQLVSQIRNCDHFTCRYVVWLRGGLSYCGRTCMGGEFSNITNSSDDNCLVYDNSNNAYDRYAQYVTSIGDPEFAQLDHNGGDVAMSLTSNNIDNTLSAGCYAPIVYACSYLRGGGLLLTPGTANNVSGGCDATLWIEAPSDNDWGLVINKASNEYGQIIKMKSDSTHAFGVEFGGTRKFDVRHDYACHNTKISSPIVNIGGSGCFQCLSGNTSSINLKGVGTTDMRFGFMNSSGTQLGFLYGTNNLDFGFLDAGGSWSYRHTNDASHCWFTNGGTFRALLTNGGTFCATGDVIAYSSDKRLKCNVLTISCAIDRIKSIRGVEFEWDREYICNNKLTFTPSENEKTFGFIAQELGEVIPTAMVEAPFEEALCREVSWEEKYKTIKPEKVIPLLVEATKEQQCTIEKQQRQIDTLTCQVELLLKRCA